MVAVVPHLTVVVGCPGSGKTRYLLALEKDGVIQERLEDYLEKLLDLEQNIRRLKLSLQAGCRIGISGQSFLELYRRRLLELGLEKVSGLEIEWVFFELNPKACLENIIKEGLVGKGLAKERVLSVLENAERPASYLPRKVKVLPVVGEEVSEQEIAEFFRRYDFGPGKVDVKRKIQRYLRPESAS
jgi:hypothetical protein